MRRGIWAGILILVLGGCGSGGPADGTPRETFEAWKRCMGREDMGGYHDLLCRSDREKYENGFADFQKRYTSMTDDERRRIPSGADKLTTGRDYFVYTHNNIVPGARKRTDLESFYNRVQFISEEIHGDHATVTYEVPAEASAHTEGLNHRIMPMVREDGLWRIRFNR